MFAQHFHVEGPVGFVPVLVDLEGESVNEGSSGKFRQREGKPVGRKDEEPSLIWISNQRLRYFRTRYERGEIIFELEPEKEPEVPTGQKLRRHG